MIQKTLDNWLHRKDYNVYNVILEYKKQLRHRVKVSKSRF